MSISNTRYIAICKIKKSKSFFAKAMVFNDTATPKLSAKYPHPRVFSKAITLFPKNFGGKTSAEKISADYWDFRRKNFGRKNIRRKKFRRAFSPKFFLAEIFSLVIISIHLKITFSATWNFQYIL